MSASKAASSEMSVATEMTTAEDLTAKQLRPITKQQQQLSQPISSQQSELSQPISSQQSELSQPIVSQQPMLPARCLPQPVTVQQSGVSRPITTQEPSQPQPVITQEPPLLQPITSQQQDWLSSQPIGTQPTQLPHTVTMRQPETSHAVLSQLLPSYQHPTASQPVPLQQLITKSQPESSRPITTQQPESSRPITMPQSKSSGPVTIQQPDPYRPISIQQPPLSQPITFQEQGLASSSKQNNVNSLPGAVTTSNLPVSNQQPNTPSAHLQASASNYQPTPPGGLWYPPSSPYPPSNQPASVPLLPRNTTPPVPRPTIMQDFVSHPPPPLSAPVDFSMSGIPARLPQPPSWPVHPSEVHPYTARPVSIASSSPNPGILCRPTLRTPTSDMTRFGPSQYYEAVNFDREKAEQQALPPPLMHPYGPPYRSELHASVSPENKDLKSTSSSYTEFANGENWQDGAGLGYGGGDGAMGERYDQAVYPTQYLPVSSVALNTSPSMWLSGEPVPRFPHPTTEFRPAVPVPAWSPAGRFMYLPQNPSLENTPLMYGIPPGGQPWDYRAAMMDYPPGFSMPSYTEIPGSTMPSSSTELQPSTSRQGLNFSDDHSAASASTSPDVSRPSYAEILRFAPTFQQDDGDGPNPATERNDVEAESSEVVQYDTIAGTFAQGTYSQ